MDIRVVSDLHLEFQLYDLPVVEDESETVLVLAGDIVPVGYFFKAKPQYAKFEEFFANVCARHKHVVWVFGNHEFYGYHFEGTVAAVQERLKHLSNLSILEQDSVQVDDVVFIGSTMFTDFDNGMPMVMYTVQNGMNDYRAIWKEETHSEGLITAEYILDYHKKAKANVQRLLKENAGKKVVMISHHAPSFQSIDARYSSSRLNMGYASNLYDILSDENAPLVWCHGHTHCSKHYQVFDCRVVCNPRGYYDENPSFDPIYTFEV